MTDPIVKTVVVNSGSARAFDVFVNKTSTWWPLDGHAVSAGQGKVAKAVTIEPRLGGAIYETMFDDRRADWGKVLEFEAGRKLSMTWHPGNNADAPTRVDVEFEDLGDGTTRVTLTHSGWDVWGEDADTRRGSYDGGWDNVFGKCYLGAF